MTVTIRTYPNKLDKTRFSIDTAPAGQSLTEILSQAVPSFRVMKTPPIWVRRNGLDWHPSQWDTPLSPGDCLDIDVQPKGWEILVAGLLAAVVGAAVATSMVQPDNYNQTSPDGSPIYDTNAQGNQVRLMGIIPEVFGTHATYPSLINLAHRYYFDDDEYLLLFTMIGKGFYHLTSEYIFVGNTPTSHYSGDIDHAMFDPGMDVSSHPAHRNVYTSPEVGSTAGTSGIELEGAINSIVPIKTQLNGKTLTIYQDLEGIAVPFWPAEWETGARLELSDTPGAKSIQESDYYGGWRAEGAQDILNYWSKKPELHQCKRGDYIQYPTRVDQDGAVIEWAVGAVNDKFLGFQDGVEYYAVRITNASGQRLPVNAVPRDAKNAAIVFLGKDDGAYQIEVHTSESGQLIKLYPDKVTPIPSWSGFGNGGDLTDVRITVTDSLPGKPVGPYFACPVNEVTDEIHIDVKYPEGIGYMTNKGGIASRQLRIMIEWRAEGESEWQGMEWKREAATKDQLGNTIPIKLGRHIRPQVRLYRITGKADDTRTWDTIELVRLKAILRTPTSYSDGTTLAFRIRGTNALSRSAENKLMCVPTRLLHVPDGQGGWTGSDYQNKAGMQPTDDIVPVARYVTHAVGHSDEEFPDEAWLPLHATLSERGDRFAAQFDNPDTFWEAMKRILAPGFSVPTMEYGQLIPQRDAPRTSWDHMYSPDNMTGDGMKMSVKFDDMDAPDGVEVEYFSAETWKPETVLCLLPGDLGVNPKKVKAFGVTGYQKAWQFGMRERRMMKYVNTEYSWGTEMDGFNSRYLSFVAVADDVPGYGQTGQLIDFVPVQGGVMLQLDDELTWHDPAEPDAAPLPYYLALRKPDGRLSGPYLAVRQPVGDEVLIKGELDFSPELSGNMEPPYWMFGPGDRWSFPALVTDIKPSGTDKVSMKARNYHVGVYLDDDAVAPEKGNDPVLGMALTASGQAAQLSADRDMGHFRPDDHVRLSTDEVVYRVHAVDGAVLTLHTLTGHPASLAFSTQSLSLILTHRL